MKRTMTAGLTLAVLTFGCGPDGKDGSDTNNATMVTTTNNNTTTTTNNDDSCVTDSGCDEGSRCVGLTCVAVCEDNADCLDGEICQTIDTPAISICVEDEDPPDNSTTPGGYAVFIVRDRSSGQACDSNDPGSDMIAVALEDGPNVRGWASTVVDGVELANNNHANASILNGTAPDFGGGTCPDMFDGSVVSLGCDGYIAFEFLDDMEPVIAQADDYVRAYEWGPNCTTGTTGDAYEVLACEDGAAVLESDDTSSCTTSLFGPIGGEAGGDVPAR